MSVSSVTDALATLEKTITGVKAAYSLNEIPQRLNASALPAFINWPGPATYEPMAGVATETRRYRCILYIDPLQSPAEMRYKGANAEPLLAGVRMGMLGAPGLESTASVFTARLVGDSGLVAIEDYGGVYLGVEFTVEVKEVLNVTYTD